MNTQEVIKIASQSLDALSGHIFDVLDISKPISVNAAVNLAKVISKLSPLLGNLIEFNTVEFLNKQNDFSEFGKWQRQDPGFPDTIFIRHLRKQPKSYYHYFLDCDSVRVSVSPWDSALLQAERRIAKVVALYVKIGI